MIKAADFEDIRSDVRGPPGHMAWQMHEKMLFTPDQIARTTTSAEIFKGVGERLAEVIREGRNGAAWVFTHCSVGGRKAGKI